jgi:MFS transporter, DHA1 family, tetracycline resistance protein
MQQNYESKPLATDQLKVNRKALVFLLVAVFFDLLSVGILIPVIPYVVGQFNKDALVIGLLTLSFSGAQFLATPALGILSDRYGRRPLLLLSVAGTALGYFIFGFANALWLLFAARLVDGFTGGNISIAQAYIADVSTPETKARNFTLIGVAFGLGFIIGPAIGGWLSLISLQTPVFVAGSLSLITFTFGFFVLPESLPRERRRREPISLQELNPIKQLGNALGNLNIRRFLLASFVINFALCGLQTNFVLFSFVRFGLGPQQNGEIFACIGIIAVLVQVLIIPRLLKRFSEQWLTLAGLGLMTLGFVGIASAPFAWILYPTMALIAVGGAMAEPTLTSTISNRVSSSQQGSILGATQALESLALIVGPVWAGFAFDYLGPNIPYWTGAGWLVIAALLASSIL